MPSKAHLWHALPAAACAEALEANLEKGLSPEQAAHRLVTCGPNEIRGRRRRGPLVMLVSQFGDFMILVLIAAAVISGVIGEPADTVAIIVIVVLNAVIGFVQEYRAERAIAALRKMTPASATVRRNAHESSVPATDVVPGDLLLLEAGNVVPADVRLVEVAQLRVDESALTGESFPVDKVAEVLPDAEAQLPERRNMAYKGTLVVNGRALALVAATGMQTELGRIAALLSAEEAAKTPLQKRLTRFGRQISLAVLAICAIIFAAGVLRGEPTLLMFLTAVSLAVAAIPEALPAVVTITLALGARLMVRRHALARRLAAVETLGSVTYICSDKTGTLTENRMRGDRFYCNGVQRSLLPVEEHSAWQRLALAMVLNNDVHVGSDSERIGDPTELALYEAVEASGLDPESVRRRHPRVAEVPFDPSRKRMLTVHEEQGGGLQAFVKGAPEVVLPLCTGAGAMEFQRDAVLEQAQAMAADGLRVLAFAGKPLTSRPEDLTAVECGLQFLGLVALHDPPRAEAHAAVTEARSAGITVVMITGDHAATARAIAHRLGILDHKDRVLTGTQLAHLSLLEFEKKVGEIRVYARVSPEQKIKIVRALQERGEFVAMTGDGVNDAPALKRADIGVAMGKGGTDVAREAADLVLLDDNFATIVVAVREGRRIYDNIRRFVKYALTTNSSELWTLLLAPFLGLPIPLLPIHILWINLVSDGLPGLALSAEREEQNVMRRPPRPPQESLFAGGLGYHVVWVGLLMAGIAILTQAWSYHSGGAHWQSMTFTVLTLSQMGHVLAIRSERDSLFTQGPLSNLPLLGAVLLTLVLQMAVLYVPWLNPIFKTEPLSAAELLLCLALSSIVFFAVEMEKAVRRRGSGSSANSTHRLLPPY
jgi:Ca2+-transporting ATPase